MPIYTITGSGDPGPMQHPAISLVNPDGSAYNPASSIPSGTYVQPADLGSWFMDSFSGTDDQKMTAALAAWAASATGGTIVLPCRALSFSLAWTTAYTAGVPKSLKIVGGGFAANGAWGVVSAATVVDHSYNGSGAAKLNFQHIGTVEMSGLLLKDSSGSSKPFVLSTNAQPQFHDMGISGSKTGAACDQDAFILGGTTTTVGSGDTAPYQGYGGVITRVFFDGIRTGVLGQVFCNSVAIKDNTWSITCGNSAGGAIKFDGRATNLANQTCNGIKTSGNTIEITHYKYGIECYSTLVSTFGPDDFWDYDGSTLQAGVFLDSGSTYNEYRSGVYPEAVPPVLDVSGTSTIRTSHQSQPSLLPQPQIFRGVAARVAGDGAAPSGFSTAGDQAAVVSATSVFGLPEARLVTANQIQVTDLATTAGSNSVTSPTALWTAQDVGMPFFAPGIPIPSVITRRVSAANVLISNNATATASGVTATFGRIGGALTVQARFLRQHMAGAGGVPTATVAAGAGTGATVTIAGNDIAFEITLTTGTAPSTGTQLTLTWTTNWGMTPRLSGPCPENSATAAALAAASIYATPNSTNCPFGVAVALPASTVLKWTHVVVG